MYQINDVIVYGCSEVCSIKDIGVPDFIETGEEYYYLQPVCNEATTLYVKIANSKKTMRDILSKEEATELLYDGSKINALYDKNDKVREREYSSIIRSCECIQWMEMLKGITTEKLRRAAQGKKLSMNDEQYMKKVENSLAAEFSIIFHITMAQAKENITLAIS
ncbi:MAG: CarD family transcriptional regulator [Hungatella sp.]